MTTLRKAVIPAAGHGTRMYPASATVQKELFPLVDTDGYAKPTLQIIAGECLASGIEEICIVANPVNADAIKAHFQPPSKRQRNALAGKDWALKLADEIAEMSGRIHIVVQERQEGFGHAIYQAREWAGADPVLVALGDHVYLAPKGKPRCVRQVMDVFARYDGAPVTSVVPAPEDLVYRLGLVNGEPLGEETYRVTRFVEKPSVDVARASFRAPGLPDGQYLSHFGLHAFPAAIFDALKYLIDHDQRVKGEIQLTSAQELLLKGSPLYVACTVDGAHFDMGEPDGLVQTQVALALASPDRDNVSAAVKTVKELGLV